MLTVSFGLGSICDCGKTVSWVPNFLLTKSTGFDKVQESAKQVTNMLQAAQNHEKWSIPFWTDNQNIEMLARVYVREDIEELLGNELPSETLQELKEVMFTIVYPTYAKEEQR